jgi:ethanolamine kinase
MSTENAPFDPYDSIRYINQTYNTTDSHNSALKLILTLRPEWRESKDTLEFVRFTDGITNTVCHPRAGTDSTLGSTLMSGQQLLKAINKRPGLSQTEVDNDAILLRAYGKGTDVLIDRKSECICARPVLAGLH